jgi:hypothetical protein
VFSSSCSANATQSRKLLQRSIKRCKQLHPECLSCSVQGTNTVNNSTAMICLSCTSPGYRVTAAATSCGKQNVFHAAVAQRVVPAEQQQLVCNLPGCGTAALFFLQSAANYAWE